MSRLHVILIAICLGIGGYVFYQQKLSNGSSPLSSLTESKPAPVAKTPAVSSVPGAPSVPASPKPSTPDPAVPAASNVFTVSKGDTLWAIARNHSPAKAGAAWVGIWKANKTHIKDFDHLDAGLELIIPQERGAYVTAYWKPQHFEVAKGPQEVNLVELFRGVSAVDLAELPVKNLALEVDVAQLPIPEESSEYGFAVSAIRPPTLLSISFR